MLEFNDLTFMEKNNILRVIVYKYFYKEFKKQEINEIIGDYKIKNNKLIINEIQEKKFMQFFRKFKKQLTFSLNNNRAVYIDEDMNMPLIGLNFIGIVDKGNQLLEIKPITNCNCDCSFCSVDEGPSSKKEVDFVIDKDYLVNGIKELLNFKKAKDISIWLNPHGESTLYSKLPELCKDLLDIEYVKDVSVITNGVLFDNKLTTSLKKVSKQKKKQIKVALSISGIDQKEIMGKNFDAERVLKNIETIAGELPLSITPVLLKGINEKDVKNIIDITKKLSKKKNTDIQIIIQKFYWNRRGRNPIKEVDWKEFTKEIKEWEKEKGVKLLFDWGEIKKTKQLPSLVKKNEIIKVKIISPSRYQRDKIGVLETNKGSRSVLIPNCNQEKGIIKAKVVQNKYNMIIALV